MTSIACKSNSGTISPSRSPTATMMNRRASVCGAAMAKQTSQTAARTFESLSRKRSEADRAAAERELSPDLGSAVFAPGSAPQLRRVEMLALDLAADPSDDARSDLTGGRELSGNRLQKFIALVRSERPSGGQHGVELGIGKCDRSRH